MGAPPAIVYPDRTWRCADLPDDGKRYEVIGGVPYELGRTGGLHMLAASNLCGLLLPSVTAAGGDLVPPVAFVFMRDADPVQPDFVVLLPGGAARVTMRGIEGPPPLVVEILSPLSPTSRIHDTLLKRALYGQAGVREYWIVDPEARTVEVLTLHGDALCRAGLYQGNDPISSPLLPDVAFTAADVFAGLDEIAAG